MFIETEDTPNPATLKFLPGRTVIAAGTADFPGPETAAASPLARALFGLPEVTRVFLGADFITVSKTHDADWSLLKPQVLGVIMDHFLSGLPVIEGEAEDEEAFDAAEEDREIVAQIRELIDTRVRPAVAMDGGDIVLRGFRDGVVQLRLQGACSGCPSSRATLKHGIENMLKHYVPEVVAVQAVE
ncbi:NifU family protein [Elioraea sp.]|uniref:NifU family protein n=1 Tax=Elioraea sp. TaxID=2185103 RepID=UPI003F6F0C5E